MKNSLCRGLPRPGQHSFDPWYFDSKLGEYRHSCNLYGCNQSEAAKNLVPGGQTEIKNEQAVQGCEHVWGNWKTTSDQMGTYTPPYLYKRSCTKCTAMQMAEELTPAPQN